MTSQYSKKRFFTTFLLGLTGASFHLFLFRVFGPIYTNATAVLQSTGGTMAFATLGAISVALAGMAIVRESLQSRKYVYFLARAGLYAVLGTLGTVQVFYILLAPFVAHYLRGAHRTATYFNAILISMTSLQTYGLVPMVGTIPPAFLFGLILGALSLSLRNYLPPPSARAQPATRNARIALPLGLFGLLLFWLPVPGGVLCVLAIFFGARSIHLAREEAGPGKNMAVASLVLGILGIVSMVLLLSYDWGA